MSFLKIKIRGGWLWVKKIIDDKLKFELDVPKQNKTDLERAKLYLELKREKSRWRYLNRVGATVPIVTLIVTGYILFNQTKIEQRRLESEITSQSLQLESELAKQFAATIKDLDHENMSTRMGAILALENFIYKSKHYRSQVYLLLGTKLADETSKGKKLDKVLLNQIIETLRKVSDVRLTNEDPPLSLYLENCNFDSLFLNDFDFRGANLWNSSLKTTVLWGADLRGARLSGADLNNTTLYKANLSNAFLWNTDLREAILLEANLSNAQLQGANLVGAYLSDTNLTRVDLRDADLTGVNLKNAKNLTAIQLIEAKNWEKAELDSSLRAEAEKLVKANK